MMSAQRERVPKDRKANFLPVTFHEMNTEDLPEILAIEQESFEFAWKEGNFIHCMIEPGCTAVVAKSNKRVVGFFVCISEQIINFAVAKNDRRKGIGSQMMKEIINIAVGNNLTGVYMMVRQTNHAAQLFFQGQGLNAEAKAGEGYYKETSESAYMMRLHFTYVTDIVM